MFQETKEPQVQTFIEDSEPYLQQLEGTIREDELNNMMDYLRKTPSTNKGEHACFAGFPGMAVLEGNSENEHIDSRDSKNGMCCCTALGDFTGGEIEFSTLNLRFAMRPGDVILFRSHLLHHRSAEVTSGRRFALVSPLPLYPGLGLYLENLVQRVHRKLSVS
jgi:hypothetical protein